MVATEKEIKHDLISVPGKVQYSYFASVVVGVHCVLVLIAVGFSLLTRFAGWEIVPGDLNSLLGGGMLALSPIVLLAALYIQNQAGGRLPILALAWLAMANGALGYVVYLFVRDGVGR